MEFDTTYQRDSSIIETRWMTRDEIAASEIPLRHSVVLDVIDQYRAGSAVTLDLVRQL